jgi:hypothetical protein
VPFQTVDLSTGCGNFDDNADSDLFEVECPPGVTPCPAPTGAALQPLQSGEYTITYTKTVGGNMESCTFPLYVGARGLRVELSWNYQSSSTIDLDLHMHEPQTTTPWATSGAPQDCGFANCKAFSYVGFPTGDEPEWFPPGNVPPDPVNWYEDPQFEGNSCYFAPQGAGDEWSAAMMGCHSPRLDLDNISCNPASTDPADFDFCAPENTNIDYPPKNQWIRVAVHYYQGTSSHTGTVRPNVKIFCDGALSAELGDQGFNDPPAPFVWTGPQDENDMWMVADVLFAEDECVKGCTVRPLYLNDDTNAKVPVVVTAPAAELDFGMDYLPVPP